MRFGVLAAAVCVVTCLQGQDKPAPDTLIFVNGEQLTGELERANSDGITFKSAMAGEITVKWSKVKELRSDKNFAVLTVNERLTRRTAAAVVPQGKIVVEGKQLSVVTATGTTQLPVEKADRIVDAGGFDKAVNHPPNILQGWGGTASSGVSLVRSTQNSTTFTGAINLVRATPLVDWLPARSRTNVDYNQSYGTTYQSGLAATTTVKTNIYHADAERDQYFSPRAYSFGSVTFDHNFSQALDLQQAYGAGVGITLLKNAVRTLDFKGDVHYEKQTFFLLPPATVVTPSTDLFGSTFSEKYLRYLPKGLVLNEFGSISPSWNETDAYAAHVNVSLGFPVYKGLGFSVSGVDDYLNNAPAGSKKNSTQLTTGLTYTIKPR